MLISAIRHSTEVNSKYYWQKLDVEELIVLITFVIKFIPLDLPISKSFMEGNGINLNKYFLLKSLPSHT